MAETHSHSFGANGWPFEDPEDVMAITTVHVLEGRLEGACHAGFVLSNGLRFQCASHTNGGDDACDIRRVCFDPSEALGLIQSSQ